MLLLRRLIKSELPLTVPVAEVPKRCYSVTMERNEQVISTNTRYPKQLHEALRNLAYEHKRSFNAEVMWALQLYVHQEAMSDDFVNKACLPRSEGAGH